MNNADGLNLEVIVDLGDASSFARFNPFFNSLVVDSENVLPEYANTYMIRVDARLYNATYELNHERCQFLLTIRGGQDIIEPDWVPPNLIDFKKWEG